jgi:hypothetical protein
MYKANGLTTRPNPLAATKPKQIRVSHVQLPERQCGAHGPPRRFLEALPARARRQDAQRLEDIDRVISPDL